MVTQTFRPPIETHEVHSERLLRHAYIELEKGDRLQTSEKAWGAVAHAIKAVATHRGWRYDVHLDASRIIRRLVRETGDPRFRYLFNTANYLHQNYYKDVIPLVDLRECLEDVEELVAMLNALVERG